MSGTTLLPTTSSSTSLSGVRYSDRLREAESQLDQSQRKCRVLEREKRLLGEELQRVKAVVDTMMSIQSDHEPDKEQQDKQQDVYCLDFSFP